MPDIIQSSCQPFYSFLEKEGKSPRVQVPWPRLPSPAIFLLNALFLHRLDAEILSGDADRGFLSTFRLQNSQGPATPPTSKSGIVLHPALPERAASSGWDPQVLAATEKRPAQRQGREPGNMVRSLGCGPAAQVCP